MNTLVINAPLVILFDLDGTLIDSSDIVVEAYYQSLLKYEFPIKERKYIASLAGRSTFDTARAMGVPEEHLINIDKFFWDYFGNYAQKLTDSPNLFPGTKELIEIIVLKNVKIGIITSNEAKIAKILMEKATLMNYFSVIVGSEDPVERKPSPEPIYFALKKMEIDITAVDLKRIWFVGDTRFDVEAARAAGITSIGIPQNHTIQGIISAEPDYLIDSMYDFLKFYKDNFL